MTVRKKYALITLAAGVFAIAAIYVLWPSGPPTMAQRPPSPPPVSASPRPPLPASAPDARDGVGDQITALREEFAAASRLGTAPARKERLKSLDTELRTLETKLEPTSLAAVEVLELRQRIAFAQDKRDEARQTLHAWLADRGFTGRKAFPRKGSAWSTTGTQTLDRIYQHHLGRIRTRVERIRKEPFSQEKMARLEDAEQAIRVLGRTMPTDTKAAHTYEALLQKTMLAQAKYGQLTGEFARRLDELVAAYGEQRAIVMAIWEAEWLLKRNLPDEALALFALLAESYPTTERGSYAALMAGRIALKRDRLVAATEFLEANISARDEGRWAAESYALLGDVLIRERQHSDAIATYRLLAQRHPDYPKAAPLLIWAAKLAVTDGDHLVAAQVLNELRNRFPNSPQLPEAKKLLEWLRDRHDVDYLTRTDETPVAPAGPPMPEAVRQWTRAAPYRGGAGPRPARLVSRSGRGRENPHAALVETDREEF